MAKLLDTHPIPVSCSKCKRKLKTYRITNYSVNGFPIDSVEIEPCEFCINTQKQARQEGFYWVKVNGINDDDWQMAEYSFGDFKLVGYTGSYKEKDMKFISERLIPPEQRSKND